MMACGLREMKRLYSSSRSHRQFFRFHYLSLESKSIFIVMLTHQVQPFGGLPHRTSYLGKFLTVFGMQKTLLSGVRSTRPQACLSCNLYMLTATPLVKASMDSILS